MAKYLVNAPDRASVTIGSGYGTITLKHGQEVSNSKLAAMFPNLFVQIQGDEPEHVDTPNSPIPEDKRVFFVDAGEISDEQAQELADSVAEKLGEAEAPAETAGEAPAETPAAEEKSKGRGRGK